MVAWSITLACCVVTLDNTRIKGLVIAVVEVDDVNHYLILGCTFMHKRGVSNQLLLVVFLNALQSAHGLVATKPSSHGWLVVLDKPYRILSLLVGVVKKEAHILR